MPLTREQREQRIDAALFLLCRRLLRSDCRRVLVSRFQVSSRQADRYLRQAQERLVALTGKTVEEHRAASLAFYESIVSGPDATLAERLAAQVRIDKLLGLEAPVRQSFRHTGPDGGPLPSPPIVIYATSKEAAEASGARLILPDNGRGDLFPGGDRFGASPN